MDTIRAQKTNAIFTQIASNTHERVEHGKHLREEMRQTLARGERVTGYRADWIDSTAHRVADVLGQAALEFNETNVDDMISGEDLGDVLATVMHRLKTVSDD
jgi:hypothetical protein